MTKAKQQPVNAGGPVQLLLPLEAATIMAGLSMQIEALERPAEKPLLVVSSVEPTSEPSPRPRRTRTHRVGDGRPYRGRYVDMTRKMREVPDLCAITVMGIARAEYALNPVVPLNADDFKRIALESSVYRNQSGVGAGNICAQTAEFILRVLRKIGLRREHLSVLSADNLLELVDKFIALHAMDIEIVSPLRTRGDA